MFVYYLGHIERASNSTLLLLLQDGGTPFLVACQCNHMTVAKYILSQGADVNSRMIDGASAVFLAAQNGHDNVIVFLFEAGANAHAARSVGTLLLS